MGSTYLEGVWVVVYYRQVFLPIGVAWLCEGVVQNSAYRMLTSITWM